MNKEVVTKGRVHKFGDDINTDYIISSRYKRDTTDCDALKNFLFADIRDRFTDRVKQGDIIAAGYNFGCGSAMEVASRVVRAAGFHVIMAKSFARSYYRNGMNNGLLLVTADTDFLREGDEVSIGWDRDDTLVLTFAGRQAESRADVNLGKISRIAAKLYEAGGLIEYLNTYHQFPV
jgi:3-isopropylmalate/(R)-2-methylmalate dehydratase small subunit